MKLSEAKHRLSIHQLWTHFQLPGKAMKSCRCPWRPDHHPSFSVFANGTKWKDHGTGEAGDALDFFQRVSGLSQPDACCEFLRMASGGYISASCFSQTSPQRPIIAPPALSLGAEPHWEALARTRAVAMLAVELAVERGLVQFGVFRGRNAWFVTDSSRRVVQARRLDGDRWWPNGPKAMNLLGGTASWPVGVADIESFSRIIMVEGGPDLLAAFHFLLLAGRHLDVTVVAMLGASNGIHPDAIGLFCSKHVRIVPHRDAVGADASTRWRRQLGLAGANVGVVPIATLALGRDRMKDLNDLSRMPIDWQAMTARTLVFEF